MNIFDFITQDEIDELPEDPALAFVAFVRHAQRRLTDRSQQLDANNEQDWHLLEEARYGFTNVVVAAAKRFGIEPFVSFSVPRLDQFKKSDDYRQFKADLDYYMTQLLLDNSIRGKRDSVLIAPTVKDKIRSYIHGLKTAIDASEFTDSKRAALLDKLTEFEKELDKRRLSLLAVTRITIAILAVPGSLWASYDIVAKLSANILQAVGEAKAADDESRQLPPADKPMVLLPPRNQDKPGIGDATLRPGFNLDDEIPF